MTDIPLFEDLPCPIGTLTNYTGQRVRTAGWIHAIRRLGAVTFVVLRDGHHTVQVVIKTEEIAYRPETVVSVEADVVIEARAPGGVELHRATFEVLSEPVGPLPLDLSNPRLEATLPTRLDWAPLALRHPMARQWLRLTATLLQEFRHALTQEDFVEIHTPKLLDTATEGGANVFAVDYFGRPAFLAQSPQFYKQMMVGVLGRVFEVGPVFRAEPHDTARHLSQYTSLDVELGFIKDHHTVMNVLTRTLRAMLAKAQDAAPEVSSWPIVPDAIPVVHFADALEMLSQALGQDLRREPDLAPAHEAWLGEWARTSYGSEFLFVEGYPTAKRPFYTHPDPDRPEFTRSFDLLFRGQELVTGGQRLHQYADYLEALSSRGLDSSPYQGYLMAFQYGMPPHGGFAIGLERLVARLMGFSNIREATLLPRDVKRLAP